MRLHGRRGAGVLSSLTGADGLVEIPVENTGVTEGDYLPFIPFREAGL
jgi:molybdopterin molybdotransferase